jgi:hypothetical protein
MKKGIFYGIGAYVTWGFFPIYWKLLHHISAIQLIGHRIIWSFLLLFVVILFTKQWTEFRATLNVKILPRIFHQPIAERAAWRPLLQGTAASCPVDPCYYGGYRRSLSHFCVWTPAVYCARPGIFICFIWTRQKTFSAWLTLRTDH